MANYILEQETETPEDFGYVREEDIPNLERIKDQLEGVLQAMYKTGDIFSMESCLDEICAELGVDIGNDSPVIEKKKTIDPIAWHAGYQKATIDFLHGNSRRLACL